MKNAVRNEYELGHAVRRFRKEQGLTQAGLAARAQVSRAFVINLESGASSGAELGRVFRVLRALGLVTHLEKSDPQSFEEALQALTGTKD